jgi:hypothetical protein
MVRSLDEDPDLARLRRILDHPAECPDETARELYSGLLDRHGDDPARLEILRELATRLHALEREGALPRSMVVRTRRRRE